MADPEIPKSPVDEIDINTETDEELIARKIESDIQASISYWQDLKERYTQYYFDFLAFREECSDSTKSNTFIPLPYIALLIVKAAIKRAILATHPYGRIIPEPFDPDLSWKLSLFYDSLLEDARYRTFVDIACQDSLIYGNAVYQVTWEQTYKQQPQFTLDGYLKTVPAFDENEERIWKEELIRDGICLTNIHIQDFFMPKCISAESAPWNAIVYRKGFAELKEMKGIQNLDRLKEFKNAKRQDTNEKQRYDQAQYKGSDTPSKDDEPEIYQYVTDQWIFHKPIGADFLIKKPERNPYKQKPFHIAQIIPLNSEPYGLSPMAEGHLMAHTINEIVDVILDQLYVEDNKFFVVDSKLNDFELRSRQGNIAHCGELEPGDNVRNHIWAVETRAIAMEVMPLLQFFHQIHQKVSGGVDTLAGVPAQGAETAFENSLISQGALSRVPDYLDGLEDSLGQPLFSDIGHLLKLYMNEPKKIQKFGDGGEVSEMNIIPQEVYSKFKIKLEWVGRERSRIEERAQLTQMLQATGNMTNWNDVTGIILENLLVLSDIKDLERIKDAIKKTIQMQQQIMMMQAQGKGGSAEGASGGQDPITKLIGDAMGQSVNGMSPKQSGGGMQ